MRAARQNAAPSETFCSVIGLKVSGAVALFFIAGKAYRGASSANPDSDSRDKVTFNSKNISDSCMKLNSKVPLEPELFHRLLKIFLAEHR